MPEISLWQQLVHDFMLTGRDVLPIAAALFLFHILVLRRPVAQPGRVLAGFAYVIAGLTLFITGLERSLFPLGRMMAEQLTAPDMVAGGGGVWSDYIWVYAFAACTSFATTIAEPALIAVAMRAERASGGAVGGLGLRLAVAVGAATGVTLGTVRIVTGTPLYLFLAGGYLLVIAMTLAAPRNIIPLAYDTGGVTTSTVTVPIVTALGLGLARNLSGRDPVTDGFGLIALAVLFPMLAVMAYARLTLSVQNLIERRRAKAETSDEVQTHHGHGRQ